VYNSVGKLQGARPFDIIIFDEAHRTSIKSRGNDSDDEGTVVVSETHFTFALSDANIEASYRLFMTATPRLISNDDNSMSNTEKYGEVIFSMTIRQAVNKHIINDHKVWMNVSTHDEEDPNDKKDRRFNSLLDFLAQTKGRKTLIVCRSIENCDKVTTKLKSKGLLEVYSVHSKMNKKEGEKEIEQFRESTSRACLCAVNMFKEGIDCTAIDSVVFYDERSSVIDVLQIVGRGLRYKPHLDFTDIGILCSINPSERLDDQSEMRYLRMIIQNMFDFNEEITNHLHVVKQEDKANVLTGIDTLIQQITTEMRDNEDTTFFGDNIAMQSDVKGYGEKHFQQAKAYAQERCALFSWRVKEQWFEYIEHTELPLDIARRPDRVYKNMGWTNWDDFLGLDEEKPFDLNTLKYVLYNELKTSNPTTEEYAGIVEKYGGNKVINPNEFINIYNKQFYDIIEDVKAYNNDFIPLVQMRRLKITNSMQSRETFNASHYKKLVEQFPGQLPHFPLVYYNAPSFLRL
jgi:superfamily II DNA or RNA helicase